MKVKLGSDSWLTLSGRLISQLDSPGFVWRPKKSVWGDYVRKWKLEQGLFQKQFARILGVAEMTIVD